MNLAYSGLNIPDYPEYTGPEYVTIPVLGPLEIQVPLLVPAFDSSCPGKTETTSDRNRAALSSEVGDKGIDSADGGRVP